MATKRESKHIDAALDVVKDTIESAVKTLTVKEYRLFLEELRGDVSLWEDCAHSPLDGSGAFHLIGRKRTKRTTKGAK